jgi:hypothetical protein
MKLFYFVVGLFYASTAKGQANCDSLRDAYALAREGTIGLMTWDTAPTLLSDRSLLTIHQQPRQPIGKVFASFFVEENGQATCLEVVGAADNRLQDAALTLVSKLKFTPARLDRTYVPAMMTLRVDFVASQR